MTVEREVGGIKCGDVLAQLPDFLLGELSDPEIATLQAHVAGCDVCERFGSIYADAVAALRALAASEPLDQEVADRLSARLELDIESPPAKPDV